MGSYRAGRRLRQRQQAARQLPVARFVDRFVGTEPQLTGDEIDAFTRLGGFGHPHHGAGAAFGERDRVVRAAACFQWGIAGAPEHGEMILPNDLFGMMAEHTLDMPIADYMRILGSDHDMTQLWVADNADEIQQIRDMPQRTHDQVHAKVRAGAAMLLRAHGMTPDPDGATPFAVCLYYEPQDPPTVNWTHWAVEIGGQALETNPGVGVWKNNGGFAAYWENWVVPLDQHPIRCHTIPVDRLTDGHLRRIRAMI